MPVRGSIPAVILVLLAGCRPPPATESPPPDEKEEQTMETSLTQDDLEAIREVLAAAIESSDSEEMKELTANTATTPCTLDEDGTARIGLWVLWPTDGPELRFVWRRAGTYGPAFSAEVEKKPDGWTVTSLGPMHISPPKK
jgi:hypothetical protein